MSLKKKNFKRIQHQKSTNKFSLTEIVKNIEKRKFKKDPFSDLLVRFARSPFSASSAQKVETLAGHVQNSTLNLKVRTELLSTQRKELKKSIEKVVYNFQQNKSPKKQTKKRNKLTNEKSKKNNSLKQGDDTEANDTDFDQKREAELLHKIDFYRVLTHQENKKEKEQEKEQEKQQEKEQEKSMRKEKEKEKENENEIQIERNNETNKHFFSLKNQQKSYLKQFISQDSIINNIKKEVSIYVSSEEELLDQKYDTEQLSKNIPKQGGSVIKQESRVDERTNCQAKPNRNNENNQKQKLVQEVEDLSHLSEYILPITQFIVEEETQILNEYKTNKVVEEIKHDSNDQNKEDIFEDEFGIGGINFGEDEFEEKLLNIKKEEVIMELEEFKKEQFKKIKENRKKELGMKRKNGVEQFDLLKKGITNSIVHDIKNLVTNQKKGALNRLLNLKEFPKRKLLDEKTLIKKNFLKSKSILDTSNKKKKIFDNNEKKLFKLKNSPNQLLLPIRNDLDLNGNKKNMPKSRTNKKINIFTSFFTIKTDKKISNYIQSLNTNPKTIPNTFSVFCAREIKKTEIDLEKVENNIGEDEGMDNYQQKNENNIKSDQNYIGNNNKHNNKNEYGEEMPDCINIGENEDGLEDQIEMGQDNQNKNQDKTDNEKKNDEKKIGFLNILKSQKREIRCSTFTIIESSKILARIIEDTYLKNLNEIMIFDLDQIITHPKLNINGKQTTTDRIFLSFLMICHHHNSRQNYTDTNIFSNLSKNKFFRKKEIVIDYDQTNSLLQINCINRSQNNMKEDEEMEEEGGEEEKVGCEGERDEGAKSKKKMKKNKKNKKNKENRHKRKKKKEKEKSKSKIKKSKKTRKRTKNH
ncbi:chascon [Anaeramoeba flamelloides]|uniref:Chascon n=1 Tax=Anaeramoeba flamelloides TaxID=1746091 RepID=A0ABQ8XV94_9EUKA|nr:chascon [Anaeramoeba flamelloides]